MSELSALDGFLEKWRTRWPEWGVAEPFVDAARRTRALAWFALLQEFGDAMTIAGDPLPADAKLAWWGEELHSWQQHRSRHPLGRVLEPVDAPWSHLADTLPALRDARDVGVDDPAAFVVLDLLGRAMADVEAALFGKTPSNEAVVAQLLAQRLEDAGAGVVSTPAGDAHASVRTAARVLLARWPARAAGGRERRLWSTFARARLQRLSQRGEPAPLPSRLRLLFASWAAARGD